MSSNPRPVPEPGQAFTPYKRFRVHCVPEPLSRSRLVSAGAKLCYAALALHAGHDGRCFPRQQVLAAELAVTVRQVRRYLRELEQAKLLQTIRRGLNEPNSYTFLWHPMFDESNTLISQDRTALSAQDGTYASALDRTGASDPLKEEETPLRDSIEETRSIERVRPQRIRHEHKRSPAAALNEWPSLDVDVIRRHLEGFRYSDGNPVSPTDMLVGRLLQVAKFYARTSFELAAVLERKRREIESKPRWWPEKEDWFIAVVDRIYADDWLAARMPPASATTPGTEADGFRGAQFADNPDPDISAAIKSLAARKTFGR